jgi:hypothetical protein
MVKHFRLLISLLILIPLFGCQSGSGRIQASIDNQFSLGIGQIAELKGEQLTIQFEGIRDDSRCPKGATCIWQGNVSSILQINDNGLSSKIVLIEPGLSDQYYKNTYKQYEFTSHVQPYPELGKKISNEDYLLFLTVKKIPAGTD